MINLKVDKHNDEIANDEDLITSVDSSDAKRTAYIVKAVNNHDALVAMLSVLVEDYISGTDHPCRGKAEKLLASIKI